MPNLNLNKLIELVFDTVAMASTPHPNSTNSEIEERLSELEGDSHSFLYHGNLTKLRDANFLTNDQVEALLILKHKIEAVPNSMWNTDSFRENNTWEDIRHLADVILKSRPNATSTEDACSSIN